MPKVNLLPKEELDTRPLGRFLKWALSYGRYTIITVELIVFLVFFSRFIYDRQLADLNDEIEQKQAIIASAQAFENKFRSIQNLISYIETLDQDRKIYIDVLTIIKENTPRQVSFDSVSFSNQELTLSGEALSNESFAQFLAQLKKIDQFSSISLNSLSKDDEQENIITFNTSITIKETAVPHTENPSENIEPLGEEEL